MERRAGDVGGLTLAATGLLATVIPSNPGSRLVGARPKHAMAPRVLAILAILALSLTLFAALGNVMGFLMPLLEHVTGVSESLLSTILVAYGVANVAGSFLGGRFADANTAKALVFVTLGLVASSAALCLTAQPLIATPILAWAVFASSTPASIRHRSMSLAGPAAGIVAPLPASAASAGIALGSTASATTYAKGGPSAVIMTGMITALAALALAVTTRRLRPPDDEPSHCLNKLYT